MTEVLQTTLQDGVLWLTLNRPEVRNALNHALIDALHAAMDRADLDAEVRVVALNGAGPDFCAGADLSELLASADRTPAENEHDALRLGSLLSRLRRCPRPVVALVHGRALAGGAGLATACDIALVTESSRVGYPEIQRGFVPAMVMTILRRLVGEKVAFDLVATGRLVEGGEAVRLGLATRVEPDADFDARSRDLLGRLAMSSASAITLTKQLFYELDGRSIDDGVALGARINALARTTPDFREAISRFLAKGS
jgi:methylglutaconyl-CoA hydratase